MHAAETFSVLFWKSWAEFKAMSKPLMAGALLWAALTTAATLAAGDVENAPVVTSAMAVRALVFTLLAMLVSYAANLFFLAMTVEGKKTIGDASSRILPLALPILGVSLWMFIRSFAWVMLLGMLLLALREIYGMDMLALPALALLVGGFALVVVFAPRFSLSPYVYLMDGKGVTGSVNESWRRTRGYWGKIVGNAILLFLVVLPVTILSLIIVAILGGAVGGASALSGSGDVSDAGLTLAGAVGGAFNSWVTLLLSAFSLYFWKNLTKTVTAHPRPAVK